MSIVLYYIKNKIKLNDIIYSIESKNKINYKLD